MKLNDVVAFYGSRKRVAAVLDLTYQAVQRWDSMGKIPLRAQYQIEVLSGGKLKADPPPEQEKYGRAGATNTDH